MENQHEIRTAISAAPLVSVIMPVYNARDYVAAAIESVLAQSYCNLELILVDDGADDGSEKLCDEYANKDRRVVVLHQRNHGISHARNQGLAAARGKYIAFCDHDDLMQPNCMEAAVNAAEKAGADLVKYAYKKEVVSLTGVTLRVEGGYCRTKYLR